MAAVEINRGDTEPLWVNYSLNNAVVTGSSTVVYAIARTSDSKRLDFGDMTFKTSPVTATAAMTETPAASATYVASVDTSAFTNAVAAGTPETYMVVVFDGATLLAHHELRVRAIAAAQLDITAMKGASFDTATDSLHALRARGDIAWITATGFAVPGSAMTLAADAVDANAIAASAVAEIQSGLATAAALSSVASGVAALPSASAVSTQVAADLATAHGAGSWATATGFAAAGDAMTLTLGERASVVAAVWGNAARTLTAATGLSALASQASVDAIAAAVGALGTPLDAAATAAAVWNALAASYANAGSFGALLGTNLDTNVGSRLAASSYSAAPSAGTVAAAVVAEAIAGASAGSVGAALATASGYTVPSASAVASAVWGSTITSYGTYAQIGTAAGVLYGLKMVTFNRAVETAGNPGSLAVYADDGTTVYATMALRDGSGGAVTAGTGEPAQRGAAA